MRFRNDRIRVFHDMKEDSRDEKRLNGDQYSAKGQMQPSPIFAPYVFCIPLAEIPSTSISKSVAARRCAMLVDEILPPVLLA